MVSNNGAASVTIASPVRNTTTALQTVSANANSANANPPMQNSNVAINMNTIQTSASSAFSLDNIKQVFTESIHAQNFCSKEDLNNYVHNKFNELSGLLITTNMANEYIDSIEDLLIKQMRIENNFNIIKSHMNAGTIDHINKKSKRLGLYFYYKY